MWVVDSDGGSAGRSSSVGNVSMLMGVASTAVVCVVCVCCACVPSNACVAGADVDGAWPLSRLLPSSAAVVDVEHTCMLAVDVELVVTMETPRDTPWPSTAGSLILA